MYKYSSYKRKKQALNENKQTNKELSLTLFTLFPMAGSGKQLQQQSIYKVQKSKQSVHRKDYQPALHNKSGWFKKNLILMATLIKILFHFSLMGQCNIQTCRWPFL